MQTNQTSRRTFIQQGVKTGAAISSLVLLSPARILGANEKIRVGMIGCGGRSRWHVGWLQRSSSEVPVEVIACCDIWKQKRENYAPEITKRFGVEPVLYEDYRKLLENPDIDAVVIATPDHQHCPMLTDAVQAGKDAYVEKPIATNLKELTKAYDAVMKSGRVVQNGTQGRSSAGAVAAMQFIQAGKLGKVLRIEESRSFYLPYWNNYELPKSENDTRWDDFLYNRKPRPFDADQEGAWMGYSDFGSGTIGGWMSHFSDFNHYATGCDFPRYGVAHGVVFSPTSKTGRTAPDTVTAVLEYPEGFTTLYMTHFGNGANDYTMFFGTKGVMRINEPDGNRDGISPRVSGDGSEHPTRLPDEVKALEEIPQDDHMVNWLKCIRSRALPNANMHMGFKQGIAVLLCEYSCQQGRKMRFDKDKRRIVTA